jgi:hypothetical protein
LNDVAASEAARNRSAVAHSEHIGIRVETFVREVANRRRLDGAARPWVMIGSNGSQ